MQAAPINEAVLPICWLIGKWKSISAKGSYPTIKSFNYCEEMEYQSLGQPTLNFISKTWHPEKKNAMHMESGFLRIKPCTNQVALMVAHNFGVTTLEEGCVDGPCIRLRTKDIGRMSFVKDPPVTEITRKYQYHCDTGNLEMILCMATCDTPLTEHLRVCYQKVPECPTP